MTTMVKNIAHYCDFFFTVVDLSPFFSRHFVCAKYFGNIITKVNIKRKINNGRVRRPVAFYMYKEMLLWA